MQESAGRINPHPITFLLGASPHEPGRQARPGSRELHQYSLYGFSPTHPTVFGRVQSRAVHDADDPSRLVGQVVYGYIKGSLLADHAVRIHQRRPSCQREAISVAGERRASYGISLACNRFPVSGI